MKERDSERIEFLNIDGSGILIDLSTSGVALLLPEAIEQNSFAILYINDIEIKAKVVYSIEKGNGFRVGFQFQTINPEFGSSILDLVDKFSKGVPIKCRVCDSSPKK
jgi:hypothetical protein